MSKWLVMLVMSGLLAAGGSALAGGDAEAGKAKSAVCAACHGADGNSQVPTWPKLAGQHPKYIKKQLADFKSGDERTNELMAPIAANLSEEDMADLAAFFSSQTITAGPAPAEPKLGKRIYRAGIPNKAVSACMACHGFDGKGNAPAGFPSIAGQHADYLAKAIKDFRDKVRTNDPGGMMHDVVNRLSDRDITAVAEYVQGMQ